jgi:endonuclease YncB( thermonuclease family)
MAETRPALALATAFTGLALASSALADPCKAIPDRGPMPAYLRGGAAFSGPVTYVGDGDSLCVAIGQGHQNWVEVRLADFYAPELHSPAGPAAKAALERIAMGQQAWCRAQHRSYDRVVARCSVDGRDIGDLMRRAGIQEGGNGR